MTEADIVEIKDKLNAMVGLKAWNASLGVGSFITCEFGKALPPNQEGVIHGEWHLWVYCCSWRLEQAGSMLVSSEDPPEILKKAVERLNNLKLLLLEITSPTGDAVFNFEQEISLKLFSIYSNEYESWMVFMPNGYILTIGPGNQWMYEYDVSLLT